MRRALNRIVIISAFAVLALATSAQSASFTQGMELFRRREWAAAATAFAACEKSDPGKTDALLYRGKSLINLGQFEDAARALQSYREAHSDSDDAVYLLAYVRFRENKPEKSLRLFTEAAKLRMPTADDLKVVALDYVLLADYEDAARYLELAVKMDPANLEARYHLGRVRYQQNRFDLAIAAFQEVLKRNPTDLKAQDNLGLSLDAENKTDEAIAAYQKAIELDAAAAAHSEQPYLNLGMLLAKSNRMNDAIPLLIRATEIAPTSGKVHYELGKAYFTSDHLQDGQREAEQAVRMEPGDRPAHYLLGRIYQRLGKLELAAQQFRETEDMIHQSDAKPGSGMSSGTNPH
jgi:tetratricopeptide (TPR) repeat protein